MDGEQAESSGKVSFGFTKKKKETKVLETGAHDSSPRARKEEEPDFVLALEGREVKSTKPKEAKKELVIPLIKRNEYQPRGDQGADTERKPRAKEAAGREAGVDGSLDDDAIKEIIQDAAMHNDNWEERGNGDLNMTIPLLMQNKAPEGTETDDKLDVSIRPDEASTANYSEVPVEQFGLAMLRGMGWNQQEGIGSKMKKAVKPVEAVLRPKGQGLGADRRPADELDKKKKQRRLKPGDKRVEEEPLGFARGVGVLVTGGAHANLYGKIEGVDEDNARLVIKLALSGQTVTLSQFNAKIVDKDEYKKYSRDLSRFSKGHDEKEPPDGRDDTQEQSRHHHSRDSVRDGNSRHGDTRTAREEPDSSGRDRSGHHDRGKDKHRDRDKYTDTSRERDKHSGTSRERDSFADASRKADRYADTSGDRDREGGRHGHRGHGKHRDGPSDGTSSRGGEGNTEVAPKRRKLEDTYGRESAQHHRDNGDGESGHQTHWLRPDLRVRFIDRQYKKGKYYNCKVCIVDVVTLTTCTCRTYEGRLLEDIDQSMVETLIPKTEMACVMVVAGKLRGQLGSLLKRDKTRAQADVQLLRDRDRIERLDYDSICEYAGNIHDEDDY